jgi:hypothetical protein
MRPSTGNSLCAGSNRLLNLNVWFQPERKFFAIVDGDRQELDAAQILIADVFHVHRIQFVHNLVAML